MQSPLPGASCGPPSGAARAKKRFARFDFRDLGSRLLQFWVIWTVLILLHETGHAWMANRGGMDVERVTVGVGPVVWRTEVGDASVVLRLVPVAGVTRVDDDPSAEAGHMGQDLAVLSGGALATLAVILAGVVIVVAWERSVRRRCVWGRIVIADAMVLTVFNFLPLPPLDGGRAALTVLSAWNGSAFSSDTLFWLHLGGLALAIVPMVLWTSWTRRMDAIALRWGAPSPSEDSRRR